MPENFGSEINPHNETLSRKAELKTEFGQLRRDWFESKRIDLSDKKYSELKQAIKEFYREAGPTIRETLEEEGQTLEGEISAIAKEKLDFHKVAEIRKKLNLPKWVSLPETVAFIKTVLDLDSQDLQQKYTEYAAKGISLDDMRNVLAYENDVKPVRLDTDIYHQSPERSRSTVEVVSNAVDAVNSVSYTIGRFGVGFYQILSHLKSEKDQIKVITGNDESGYYELDFRIKDGQIQTHLEKASGKLTKGTSVQLSVENFSKEEAEELVKKHFAYNPVARVVCNGELVNNLANFGVDQSNKPVIEATVSENGYLVRDTGVGMSPQIILEKLLVPKLSGKKPVQEFKNLENINPTYLVERRAENDTEGGKVVISVGGVVIEDFELEGVNTVKTFVIDLPPFTMLGEERNQVAIDEVTILAMKKLTDQVAITADVELINSLAPVISKLQGRSMHRENENNLVEHLKQKADEVLPDNFRYLPNIPGFERLDIPKATLVDPEVKQTNWHSVSEFLKPDLSGDGYFVYVAPFKDSQSEEPVIRWRNRIVLDQKLYEKFKGDPTIINLFLKSYEQGHGITTKKLSESQKEFSSTQIEGREKKIYENINQFVAENWKILGFQNEEIAKSLMEQLSGEQKEAAERVRHHIISNFPEQYARYFVDAILYNQLEPLSEENLSNFVSLAKSEKLPQLLSDLMIYPIISRESEIDHFKGVPRTPTLDREYKDNDYSAAHDERVKLNGCWGSRDNPYGAKDGKGEWYSIKYWDRENLVHIGGEVFPGQSRFLHSSDIFLTWDGLKVSIVDRKTRISSGVIYEFPKGFEVWNLGIDEVSFGDRKLVMIDSGDFIYGRVLGHELYGGKGRKDLIVFDAESQKEFNPKTDLGEIVGYVDKEERRYRSFAVEHSYLIYAKKKNDGNVVFSAYFPDGTHEEIHPRKVGEPYEATAGLPEVILKDIEKGGGIRNNYYSESTYTGSSYGDRNYRVEKEFIQGKEMLLSDGHTGVDREGKIYSHPTRLALLKSAQNISDNKAESIRRTLETSTVESDQKHRRFLNRAFKYSDLSDESFNSIAEILLEVDDIETHVLKENLITEAEVRLGKYDKETKKWFYRLWMKMANEDWDESQSSEFLGKLSKVFSDKIANLSDAEKDFMYRVFDEARNYGQDYIVNGWNIVKFKTPIPVHLIPEKIRPLVEFLRTQEDEILTPSHDEIRFDRADQVTLSKLIQTKRLDETRLQKFQGDLSELRTLVETKTAGKKQEHIQREIIHPIYYQSVNNPYLFIRELTQNAHDAVIKEPETENKSVSLDIFSRKEKEVTLRIQDPVGMRLQEVLNYFLIPGESTKLNDKETIGYFGQGLFTLFRGSKEVVLKTSKGDGIITKLKITPQIDSHGTTADLNIAIEQEQGEFKGTVIERTIETEFPTVEAAYIKNATATFTSLVNADVIKIKLNGSDINTSQHKLAAINIPKLGEISIYDAPNNVVTQRGLFVKPIDADYSTKMRDVEDVLERKGYVISIPDQVSLTRSRNEIARKQEVLADIKEYIPLLKLGAYLEIFRQDIIKGHVIQLENLPYDYFYSDYPKEGKIFEDSQKLRKGEPIAEVDTYLERGSLISLLVLLPVVELDDKTWSLAELKEASLENKPPLESESKYEKIPTVIKNRLLEGKKEYDRMRTERSAEEERGRVVRDFSFQELEQQPSFIKEQIKQQIEAYRKMIDMAESFNSLTSDLLPPHTTLYNEPGSKAHATQGFGVIGWNLSYWKD